MHAWIKIFLSDRSFEVSWQGKTSETYQIKRGVPQGSCLSPTLFNIFFSDIDEIIPTRTAREISDFCDRWGLMLNKKNLYTPFSRQRDTGQTTLALTE